MAIRKRSGGRLLLTVEVTNTRRVVSPEGAVSHVVEMRAPGGGPDTDTLVLSSPWPGILAELRKGVQLQVTLEKLVPRDALKSLDEPPR